MATLPSCSLTTLNFTIRSYPIGNTFRHKFQFLNSKLPKKNSCFLCRKTSSTKKKVSSYSNFGNFRCFSSVNNGNDGDADDDKISNDSNSTTTTVQPEEAEDIRDSGGGGGDEFDSDKTPASASSRVSKFVCLFVCSAFHCFED